MKKTVYLNLNLNNTNDELLYNFLESLGRDKKAVLFYLLKQSGCFSSPSESPPVFQMTKKKEEHHVRKTPTSKDNKIESAASNLLYPQSEVSKQNSEPVTNQASMVAEYQSPSLGNTTSQPNCDCELKTGWERFFTQEQVAVIKTPEMSKVLEDVTQLSEFQQSKMAEYLGDSTDEFDIKEALSDAKFAH